MRLLAPHFPLRSAWRRSVLEGGKGVHALWLAEAAQGRPPPPRLVAEVQYNLVVNWSHDEAFMELPGRIDPKSPKKSLICREASRGSGKSSLVAFLRLYICEYILPFLNRPGLPIRPENRNYVVFGRDQNHLRDDIIAPLKSLILNHAPWLRTKDWESILEDADNPNPEGMRELSEMKSKGAQKWESFRIDLDNGVSIRTRTLKQSVRALHVFAGDMDDPLTEKNVSESADIKALIQAAILPALEPGGIFILDGTPQSNSDLFDLCKSDPDWDYKAHPAYDVEGNLGYAEKNLAHLGQTAFDALPVLDRACLWPARLSYAALEQARGTTRESEEKYLREYLLDRTPASSSLVHPEDIVSSKDSTISYQFRAMPGHHYRGGVDPSRLKKDEAGLCVGYVLQNGTRVPAMLRKILVNPHLPLGEAEMVIVTELNDMAKIYSCYDWMVESNGLQSAIAPLARHLNNSIRFDGFQLNANKHTQNGWFGLRTLFRTRQIKLPYATPEDRALTEQLVYQLRGLQYVNGEVLEDSKRKNDLVSALFLWVKGTEDVSPEYRVAVALAPGTVPKPGVEAVVLPGGSPRPSLFKRDSELAGYERSRLGAQRDMSLQGIQNRLAKWQRPTRR